MGVELGEGAVEVHAVAQRASATARRRPGRLGRAETPGGLDRQVSAWAAGGAGGPGRAPPRSRWPCGLRPSGPAPVGPSSACGHGRVGRLAGSRRLDAPPERRFGRLDGRARRRRPPWPPLAHGLGCLPPPAAAGRLAGRFGRCLDGGQAGIGRVDRRTAGRRRPARRPSASGTAPAWRSPPRPAAPTRRPPRGRLLAPHRPDADDRPRRGAGADAPADDLAHAMPPTERADHPAPMATPWSAQVRCGRRSGASDAQRGAGAAGGRGLGAGHERGVDLLAARPTGR